MDLKAIARRVEVLDGCIVLYLMPYETGATIDRFQAVRDALGIKKGDHWKSGNQATYASLEQYAVAIEFPETGQPENSHVENFRRFWVSRNGDYQANDEVYAQVVSTDLNNVLWTAIWESREKLPAAPGLLGEPSPDHVTEKKSSRSGGKRSKRTSSH